MTHAGKQPIMRSSLLTSDHFGPYHNASFPLQPGMLQHMQYQSNDPGPCYLSAEKKEQQKFDKRDGQKVRVLKSKL